MTDSPETRNAPFRRARHVALSALAALCVLGGGALVASIPQAGLERAIAAQRALAAERPADATVREDLGSLLALADDLAGAEAAYREAIAIAPESASAHFQLGGVLEKQGHDKKALEEYRAAIEIDPNHAWAWYESGTIYAHRGLDGKAKRAYAKALGLDPTLADAQVNPHILENRLATSAMILAYRDYTPETGAPPVFHEPARIAGLILEKPAEDRLAHEEEAAPAATEHEGGFARSMSGGERAPEVAAEGENSAESDAQKTLTSRDLDTTNRSGQVVTGGTGVGTVGGRKSSAESAAERAKAREAARQSARTGRTPATGAGGGTMLPPQNPGWRPPTGGTPGGGGFTPAPDSSGRIEVRLDERAG